ncbi:MAG: hypothetical protein KAQ65_01130 [Candidatus Thorarchaeota archaeon]|nr:hypothetical protein [Candidatus Thorarchaeota archaeon]MCK5239271.1 hypothetical protein [Candidatus Thorarchaeota archaeon]
MKSVKVTVFTSTSDEHGLHVGEVEPKDPGDENCDDGSCDPASSPAITLNQSSLLRKCLDAVKNALGESVNIEVLNYEDSSSTERGIEILNNALELAGTEPLDSPERFTMFVNSSAPLFVIGNRIAFTGAVPPSPQVVSRVKATLRKR